MMVVGALSVHPSSGATDVDMIKIPIKKDDEFDLDKQKEIANKYKIIEEIKNKIKEDYQKILDYSITIS